MKNQLLFFSAILFVLGLGAQEIPRVILKDSSELRLSNLHVDVKIIGNLVTTTYKMKFYNSKNRILEGELAFPLGQGQSVSEFAMEVNGKMRKAVIVEKELARVAYENTIQQKIDPGLLEQTQGNNYRARIYPIPAKGYKEIEISHEQNLFIKDKAHFFELPLGFESKLEVFSVHIEVDDQTIKPIIDSGKIENLEFKEWEKSYVLEINKRNFIPKKSLVIKIPVDDMGTKIFTDQDYFHIYKTLTPQKRLKKKPKKVTILWDSSFSMKNRMLDDELCLLEEYFMYLSDVEVQLVGFSNAIKLKRTFRVNQGNWSDLKEVLLGSNYDGGTSFEALNLKELQTDEFLLFSDGMDNLGALDLNSREKIYVINSIVSANHKNLDTYAVNTGGAYINLRRHSKDGAQEILKNEVFQLLGTKHGKSITEVYPKNKINVSNDLLISGRFKSEAEQIELHFGFGNEITQRYKIDLKKKVVSKNVSRIWAKNKLDFLTKNSEENKVDIIRLAKRYQLISPYTSMLILDRVQDYAKYRIEPPRELKGQYKQLVKNLEEEEAYKLEEIADRKEELMEDYLDFRDWWNTDFSIKKKKAKPVKTVVPTSPDENNIPPTVDTSRRVVSGTVTDQDDLPLPGANVLVVGTSRVTQTDFDGNYWINAEPDERLEFSYIGMKSTTLLLDENNLISISLSEDSAALDEVVVTGMGIRRESRSLGYAVSTVTVEEMESNQDSDVSRLLSGKASGVQITSAFGASGTSQSVQIRGLTSFSASNEPLYVIDGYPASESPLANLMPDDIASMTVLKSKAATALYGARGIRGVIIITTKKGIELNSEAIEALEGEIKDKITLKPWNPDTPYLELLEKEKNIEDAYVKYLEIRKRYLNVPTFYIDVADFFDKKGDNEIAITVLSNLIEIELDNHELMRALAYKLEYFKKDDLAIHVYKEVLKLRPEEPQSYRDLALAYKNTGNYEKAYQLLRKIVSGELLEKDENERFYGIEQLAYVEMNNLVFKNKSKISNKENDSIKLSEMPVDIRIVVDWNHNDTDLDLWVEDPKGERCYYGHPKTEQGGKISEDMTDGYGPEEFILKNAIPGKYRISVDYFADTVQKISGPTMLKVTIYIDYGKPTESRKVTVVRLDQNEIDKLEVGSIQI